VKGIAGIRAQHEVDAAIEGVAAVAPRGAEPTRNVVELEYSGPVPIHLQVAARAQACHPGADYVYGFLVTQFVLPADDNFLDRRMEHRTGTVSAL
jgi:hypothetical protein